MKTLTRIKYCLLALLSCVAVASAQSATPAADSNDVTSKVDKVFSLWDKPTSPGCALAVIKDGRIVYKRGYGQADLDHDIPISSESVFHVASVSKQFTAFSIMLLAQQGKLSLDDPVRKYIPELRDFGKPLTIRHLLHHTSGIRDQWNLLILAGWRLSEDVVRDDDVLELVSRMKELNFNPGDQHLYCNTGYTLLAQIVKRVSGDPLRVFAENNIFKPLGMSHSFFRDDHAVIVKNQAYAYNPGPGGLFKLSVPNYDTVGASSLLTTVEDLAKWDQNFYDFRVGGKALIEQMQVTGVLNNGEKINYAMGLIVQKYKGLPIVEHSGGDAGYRSHIMRFPEQRFSVVCLCNAGNANPSLLARLTADVYLAGQFTEDNIPKPQPPPPAGVTLTDKQRENKIGTFWNSKTDEIVRISQDDGKLRITLGPNSSILLPLAEDRFFVLARRGEVLFEPAEGRPRQLTLKLEGVPPVLYDVVDSTAPTAEQLAQYAGAYYSDEIDATYRLSVRDGKLVLMRQKYPPETLSHAFGDSFTSTSQIGMIKFVRDDHKQVTGFTAGGGRVRNLRFIKHRQ